MTTVDATSEFDALESPFSSLESDFDPIMIAARLSPWSKSHPSAQDETDSDASSSGDKTPQSASLGGRSDTTINIIALGKTGDGKSSLLNDMLGREAFKHKRAVQSQTAQVQEDRGFWAPLSPHMPGKAGFGCNIRVIDTPGFGDSQLRDAQFLPAIQERIRQVASDCTSPDGGLHCILLVHKVTTSADHVMMNLRTLQRLMGPNELFWDNVILVFTHADASNIQRYRGNKAVLQRQVGPAIMEQFGLQHPIPMVFLSTQTYSCSYIKGIGECDCVRGNRYHADCRRRFYEQVWRRRAHPFYFSEPRAPSPESPTLASTMDNLSMQDTTAPEAKLPTTDHDTVLEDTTWQPPLKNSKLTELIIDHSTIHAASPNRMIPSDGAVLLPEMKHSISEQTSSSVARRGQMHSVLGRLAKRSETVIHRR